MTNKHLEMLSTEHALIMPVGTFLLSRYYILNILQHDTVALVMEATRGMHLLQVLELPILRSWVPLHSILWS